MVTNKTQCRICSSSSLFQYLDLGDHPLANSYIAPEQATLPEFKAPLALQLCESCGLSQLTNVVEPDLMFSHYVYVSSTPKTFRDHCDNLVKDLGRMLKIQDDDALVLDIASNDGCLLQSFKKQGFKVLGVDPAKNLAAEANSKGIRTICDYWSPAIASKILEQQQAPSIITAQNVFAHVDDMHSFVAGMAKCLKQNGLIAIECPYLLDFIKRNLFDTAYHEHLSYVAITPVVQLLKTYNLEIVDLVFFPDIHGGTVRIIIAHAGDYRVEASVSEQLQVEENFGLKSRAPYIQFADRVLGIKENLLDLLTEAKTKKRRVWAYGAGAKGNTLLNFFRINSDLVEAIVDDNPKKWGLLTPGSRLPILKTQDLANQSPAIDDLLLLAWNFSTEIMARSKEWGFDGEFICPLPTPTRLKNN